MKHIIYFKILCSGTIALAALLLVAPVALATVYQATIPYTVGTVVPSTMSVSLNASPATLTLPTNQTELSWSTSGTPDACVASSSPTTSWTGARATSGGGPESVSGLTVGSYVFTLTCSKTGEPDVSDTALVVVNSSGPDLVASSITPYVATINVPLTFSGMVTNQGNADTGGSFPVFFQVASAASGGGSVADLTSSTVGTLASGASTTTVSPSYTFISTGTKSVRLCADKSTSLGGGVIAESDESNNCGSWTRVTVSPAQTYLPSVTLSAAPSSVYTGGSATLSWVSSNVSSCTASASPASGSWIGARATSSVYPHESTGALSASTNFMIDCTGAYGAASSQARVTVTSAGSGISVNLTATPARISLGDSSVLAWSSVNATSCVGKNFSTGGATSGTTSVSPVVDTTYQMECTDGVDAVATQATVTLKRKFLFIEY